MGCNGWRSGTSTSHPSARPSGRRDARTVQPPSRAARSCRWPGRRRSSCSPAPSATGHRSRRRDQDGFRLVPRLPRVPAAVPRGLLQLRRGHQLRARRRPRARRDRRDAAARGRAGRAPRPAAPRCPGSSRSTRCSPPRRPAAAAGDGDSPRARRSRSSFPWCRTRRSASATPATRTDNGLHEPPVDDAIRKLKLQARLVQPGRLGGWVAGTLSWSRLDYLLLRDEFPARARPPAARALRPLPGQLRRQHSGYYR